jgi:hypothetical protein
MKLLLILFLTLPLFALSSEQAHKLQVAYYIGTLVKTSDGFSFEKTLCAIMLQESSAGEELIGDKYADGKLKSLYDSSIGVFQIKLSTVKFIIKSDDYMNKNFKHLLKNDKKLINMLLTSTSFSTLVAATYLKMNYEVALRRGYRNPWHSAISRYNGGWRNTTYKNKIFKRLEYVNTLKIF